MESSGVPFTSLLHHNSFLKLSLKCIFPSWISVLNPRLLCPVVSSCLCLAGTSKLAHPKPDSGLLLTPKPAPRLRKWRRRSNGCLGPNNWPYSRLFFFPCIYVQFITTSHELSITLDTRHSRLAMSPLSPWPKAHPFSPLVRWPLSWTLCFSPVPWHSTFHTAARISF